MAARARRASRQRSQAAAAAAARGAVQTPPMGGAVRPYLQLGRVGPGFLIAGSQALVTPPHGRRR